MVSFVVVAWLARWEDVAHNVRAALANWDEMLYMKIVIRSAVGAGVIEAGKAISDLLRGHLKQMASFYSCLAALAFFFVVSAQQWLG